MLNAAVGARLLVWTVCCWRAPPCSNGPEQATAERLIAWKTPSKERSSPRYEVRPNSRANRAHDLDLADQLGFDEPRKIRELIERNMKELLAFGVCPAVGQTPGPAGGRPSTEYYLNEEQALLVAVLSKAPNPPAVRAMLIRVFVAWRRGRLASAGVVGDLSQEVRSAIGGRPMAGNCSH